MSRRYTTQATVEVQEKVMFSMRARTSNTVAMPLASWNPYVFLKETNSKSAAIAGKTNPLIILE